VRPVEATSYADQPKAATRATTSQGPGSAGRSVVKSLGNTSAAAHRPAKPGARRGESWRVFGTDFARDM